MPLVTASLQDKSSAVSNTSLYPLLVDLLTYLHRLSTSQEAAEDKKLEAKRIQILIYTGLEDVSVGYVEEYDEDCSRILPRLGSMLESFTSSTTQGKLKPWAKGVKFIDVDIRDKINASQKTETAQKTQRKEAQARGLVVNDGLILPLVCKCCCSGFKRTKQQPPSLPHVRFFSSVLQAFSTQDELLEALLSDSGTDSVGADGLNLTFVDELLIPWVNRGDRATDEGNTGVEREAMTDSKVKVLFTVYNRCGSDDRCKLLDRVIQVIKLC